jgi:hypothetical protein
VKLASAAAEKIGAMTFGRTTLGKMTLYTASGACITSKKYILQSVIIMALTVLIIIVLCDIMPSVAFECCYAECC